jgi:hypothetical protein
MAYDQVKQPTQKGPPYIKYTVKKIQLLLNKGGH